MDGTRGEEGVKRVGRVVQTLDALGHRLLSSDTNSSFLNAGLKEYIAALQAVEAYARLPDRDDPLIPWGLLETVDAGKEPQEFASATFQTLLDRNQKTAGRGEALKMLLSDIEQELARIAMQTPSDLSAIS